MRSSETRGVVTTCNYEARKFGVRSAMPSITAKKLCPDIVFIPVHMDKYRNISKEIHKIFKCYTKVIEPISLDEAYLDVTYSKYCNGDPSKWQCKYAIKYIMISNSDCEIAQINFYLKLLVNGINQMVSFVLPVT